MKAKRALSALLSLCMIITAIPTFSLTAFAETEGDFEYSVSDSKATITKYNGSDAELDVPSTLGGYPVTVIGDYAFNGCSGLTSITITNSVESLGAWSFSDCVNLTSITIPESVTNIGRCVFIGCSSLTSITVNDDNAYYSSQDGVLFNKNKTELIQYPIGNNKTSYEIYESVTHIGENAFAYCESVKSITIPNGVKSIGDGAFLYCSNLESIDIPESVKVIGNYSFEGCQCLTGIIIPDGVTNIGFDAFFNCVSLKNITIGDSVTTIDYCAFYFCSNISNVSISSSVISVGESAFSLCDSLISINVDINNAYYSSQEGVFFNKDKTNLIQYPIGSNKTRYEIPDSVTSISKDAFLDCDYLRKVIVPSTVISIGENAFNSCTFLKDIYYTGTKNEWKAITIADNNDSLKSAIIHCSDGLIYEPDSSAESEYKLVDGVLYSSDMKTLIEYPVDKKDKEFVIPGSVTTIAENAFKSEYLEKVTVSKNVSKIGNDAFKACTNLKSVIIEDGTALKTLDNSFSNLPIKDITLGKGIEVIGESALEGTSVEKVVLPETARVIKTRAFANINNNLVVVIPDDVYDIQVNAFVRGSGVSGKTTFVTNKNSTAHKYAKKNGIAAKGIGSIVVNGTYVYSGTAIVPRFVVYDFNDKPLKLKSDYTVIRYENNINAGKNANIVIKGAGDYRGLAKNKTFTINPAPASRLSVTPAVTEKFYTGKVIYPSVKVTDTNKKAVTSYKMSATAKKIGLNTVTLTFSGNYTKTRNVSVIIKPKAVKTKKLRKGRGAFVQKWTKIKGVSGYQVIYSLNKNMSGAKMKNVSSKKKNLKVKKLQSKKRYYVRVRAYVTVNGKKYYGKWSKKRSVKTK